MNPARPQFWPAVFKAIRRRADGQMARDRRLLVPGVEPAGLHADGDIEIEPDLHAELAGAIPARPQLPVGDPLHEFDEFDLGAIGALAQTRRIRPHPAAAIVPAIPTMPC